MRLDANVRTWNWLGLFVFAAMAVTIFWVVWPWYLAPVAPDAAPFFALGFRTEVLEKLVASGGEFTPQHLYWLIFNSLLANKLTYIIDTLMLSLAGIYYLRGRGAGYPAAWVGGLALGFCGYTFTLFSAGHRGYFHMMGCAVFVFGLLLRCFGGRRWFHFAMLGACLAWGITYQADVLVMVMGLAGAYALWLTFARGLDVRTPWQRVVQVYPRFLLSLAVALAIAWSGIRVVLDQQVAGRKAVISDTSGTGANSAASLSPEAAAAKKNDQWIFATNWSLPPEDVVEFIVPGIFGNDSFQPPYPYWGRLGQAYGWQPGQRSMSNYRQHTVYLGGLTVWFAIFAGMLWWRSRSERSPGGPAVPRTGNSAATSTEMATHDPANHSQAVLAKNDPLVDVPFWVGAWVVCLLLAMGRYTPFYRLFYAIPYMDLIRCPVKFHHLVEICSAFLCGLGVEMWWRGAVVAAPAKRGAAVVLPPTAVVARRMAMVALAMAGVLMLAAGGVAASSQAMASSIARLGLGAYGDALVDYTVENLVRAAGVVGVAALLFWLGRPRVGQSRPGVWLLVVLVGVLAVDSATVAQRFMRPMDLRPFYVRNVVSEALRARGGIGCGVANYVGGNEVTRDWFACSLWREGARLALAPVPGSAAGAVMQAVGKRPEVLWRALHARFVIAPWKNAAPLVKGQLLEPLVSFALGQERVQSVPPSADASVLAAFSGALPGAYVVDGWQGGLEVQAQVQQMGGTDWDPARTTLCDVNGSTNAAGHIIGHAQVTQLRGYDFHLTTALAVDTPQAGLLVSDELYADDLVACLDRRETPVHCANALWAAVEVPAGKHTVTIRRRSHVPPVLVSAMVGLALGLWGALRLVWGARRSGPMDGSRGRTCCA